MSRIYVTVIAKKSVNVVIFTLFVYKSRFSTVSSYTTVYESIVELIKVRTMSVFSRYFNLKVSNKHVKYLSLKIVETRLKIKISRKNLR